MDPRYATAGGMTSVATGAANLSAYRNVPPSQPPPSPMLQMIGSELASSVKELAELVSQARSLADSIFGEQPQPADGAGTNGASGSLGAVSLEVASLRQVTGNLREQLNRLSCL